MQFAEKQAHGVLISKVTCDVRKKTVRMKKSMVLQIEWARLHQIAKKHLGEPQFGINGCAKNACSIRSSIKTNLVE